MKKQTITQQATKTKLAKAYADYARNPSSGHWVMLEHAMRAHQIAMFGGLLTLTIEINANGDKAYGLTGDLVDHDGQLFGVGEFSFNKDRIMQTLTHYKTQFDNVVHHEVTRQF
jgi:hypothetical protein